MKEQGFPPQSCLVGISLPGGTTDPGAIYSGSLEDNALVADDNVIADVARVQGAVGANSAVSSYV